MTVTANSVITPQSFNVGAGQNGFTNANGTGALTVFTPGANGAILFGLNVYSTDGTARVFTLNSVVGGVTTPLVSTSIPITAGSVTGTPPVNVMSTAIWPSLPRDPQGNPYYNVAPGETLTGVMATAPTAAAVFSVKPVCPQDL